MKGYSFQDVVVIIAAPPRVAAHQVTGFADGDDAIQLARAEDAAMSKVGAGGQMAVALNANRSGEITLKLFQQSPTNKVLNDILILQQNTRTWVPISLTFQDLTRLDSALAVTGFIKKMPDVQRGQDSAVHEWVIVTQELQVLLGDPKYIGFATALSEASF